LISEDFYLRVNERPIFLMDDQEAANFVYPIQCKPGDGAVRVIRGWKCATEALLHEELGAALQFPSYYGENWDAFDECITDLSWMPARWYLIHVAGVQDVAPKNEDAFRLFVWGLNYAGRAWGHPEEFRSSDTRHNELKRPFNTIISGTVEGRSRVEAALRDITP